MDNKQVLQFKEPVTKERLKRYARLKQEIDNQYERLARMTAALESPARGAMDGMPHSNYAVDRMAAAVARKIELEKTMRDNLRKEAAEVAELERAVQLLAEPDERQVLRLKYIDGLSWAEVNETLHDKQPDYDEKLESYQRRTYRIHGSALIHIEGAIGGRVSKPE